jgi:hypothetical protein
VMEPMSSLALRLGKLDWICAWDMDYTRVNYGSLHDKRKVAGSHCSWPP